MDINQIRALLAAQSGAGGGGPMDGSDRDVPDTSETTYVAALPLLKMLKHARAGIPMEVMGLMLGEFVDDYTVRVVDVFAMPQSGSAVTVESVDPVYQQEMLEMLQQTGRSEMVVGWYHSHPGFGCWLSGVDVGTQKSFEQLNKRAVALVVDPLQSVKGKVVMDAFRTMDVQTMMTGAVPRQTTSNVGHIVKPSIQALLHNLNRQYYSLNIGYRKDELEQRMLLNLKKRSWAAGLKIADPDAHSKRNEETMQHLLSLAKQYNKRLEEEEGLTQEQLIVANVGKIDPKRHLESTVEEIMTANISQCLGTMLDTIVF